MTTFTIGDSDFLLNGKPHQIIAGALHYFRIHPEHWADRIHKARLMGLNTIETYVAWNAHEPVRGEWTADGWNDLGEFLDLVAAEGMHAIVRPGPYICAEWHNGGLPVWLTGMDGAVLRSSEPTYLEAVTDYLTQVYAIVAPRQVDRGGNVILVQIENEYGAYGQDHAYLRHLTALTRELGITVPLTTVDQPEPEMLRNGSIPELHKTGSFGSRAGERLTTLREHQPHGPLMCSEFWDGWFDWWGGVHHTTSAAESAAELDVLLAAGASVNIYMVHGGTNFGTTNGANDKGRYAPTITSYDYDAPLDESGFATEKFHAYREVISRYADVPIETVPTRPAAAEITVPLIPTGEWSANPGTTVVSEDPASFEELAQRGPLVRYDVDLSDQVPGTDALIAVTVEEVRDMAWFSVDGVRYGRLSRAAHQRTITVPRGARLSIVVEEQGRVNYGKRIGEAKGLIGPVYANGHRLRGWTSRAMSLDDVVMMITTAATSTPGEPGHGGDAAGTGTTGFYASVELDKAQDLFLDTQSWGKGFAIMNGFVLGRYWNNGPQQTLYVPGPVTRPGINSLVVVELDDVTEALARFVSGPLLGHLEE